MQFEFKLHGVDHTRLLIAQLTHAALHGQVPPSALEIHWFLEAAGPRQQFLIINKNICPKYKRCLANITEL